MKISRIIRFPGWISSITLVLTIFWIESTMSLGGLGLIFHKPTYPAGYVRTKAYIHESPEIGIGIHKVPVMLPMPMLIFRKKKHLITRPVMMPICNGCVGGEIQLVPAHPSISPYGRGYNGAYGPGMVLNSGGGEYKR